MTPHPMERGDKVFAGRPCICRETIFEVNCWWYPDSHKLPQYEPDRRLSKSCGARHPINEMLFDLSKLHTCKCYLAARADILFE